jgi:CotH kinase protein
MRAIRFVVPALVLSVLGGFSTASASADAAAAIFDPSAMSVIKLTLPQKSREGLAADRDKYQPGTFSLAETDGTPGEEGPFSTPVNVKIKLKGSASYRPLSEKSAFKIKFEEAPFEGLRTITLNNMVEDPSMIHETLAYTAFRGAGVPASRTGYAYVYVDGDDYGIHLNIEALDEVALEKLFGSFDPDVQHLYEGEDAHDVSPGGAGAFEVDEGDKNNRGDLEALIQAVNSSGPPDWATRVASVADLQEMTRMWAAEKYIGQWDGYAGSEAEWLPNNYYLYSDSSGRFQMMPWGNDESWQTAYRLSFDGSAGLLFDSCLEDATCAAIYRESVIAVRQAIAGMNLDAQAASTAAMLAPWQQKEQVESTREEHDIGEIEDEVADTRAFIAVRPGDVAAWLGEEQQQGGSPVSATSGSPAPYISVSFPSDGLRVGRAWVAKGVLRTQARPWTRGVLIQRVTVPTAKGPAVVCRKRVRVKRAGELTLSCRLPASVRRRLDRERLSITVAIRFLPASGGTESATRRITPSR